MTEAIKPCPRCGSEVRIEVDGSTSDGCHTFDELYHHRAILFSVIVSKFHDRAWKSKRHHDGTMYDGMFIVGIDTPGGQATYHYDLEPYWGLFTCKEVGFAPEWDGHTPEEAIERIGSLRFERAAEEPEETEDVSTRNGFFECKACGCTVEEEAVDYGGINYCPDCGKWVSK